MMVFSGQYDYLGFLLMLYGHRGMYQNPILELPFSWFTTFCMSVWQRGAVLCQSWYAFFSSAAEKRDGERKIWLTCLGRCYSELFCSAHKTAHVFLFVQNLHLSVDLGNWWSWMHKMTNLCLLPTRVSSLFCMYWIMTSLEMLAR